MGADSGLTMAMIRSAETRFPNPIPMSFKSGPSLYVLDLLADLFNLGFEIDHCMGNIRALAL